MCSAHGTFGLTYTISLAWLPTYYAEQFNLDVKRSSHVSVLPWAAMAVGTNASGWAADLLVNNKARGGVVRVQRCSLARLRGGPGGRERGKGAHAMGGSTRVGPGGWCHDDGDVRACVRGQVLGLTQTRKCLQLIGTLGPGLCFAYLALVPQVSASGVGAARFLEEGCFSRRGLHLVSPTSGTHAEGVSV